MKDMLSREEIKKGKNFVYNKVLRDDLVMKKMVDKLCLLLDT